MPSAKQPAPAFFATAAEFRAWLEANHETETELLVGLYKKGSGKPSITWPESVDQALCFGWIDGVRRSLGNDAYTIRFTPRKPNSIWSAVNVAKVTELERQGLMRPAGKAAFARRSEERTGVYSFERGEPATLAPEQEAAFRAVPEAWEYFNARPAGYRRTAIHFVVSAKRPETRARRLQRLIEDSRNGRTIKELTRPSPKKR
jgi:uncharacterized protein YdeI (YjbR/CyaY-like superfamily)